MSYTLHGFVSGRKLTGQDMAEVDQQIFQNEEDLRSLEESVAGIPAQRLADIRRLSLSSDADTIYLYYGTELLASVSMPDVSSLIPCTGLTVAGTLTDKVIGDTAQITASRQPADCNQSVRFRSLDTSVATVNSSGLVTVVGSGVTSIQVSCGSYSRSLPVTAKRKLTLTGKMTDDVNWLAAMTTHDIPSVQFNVTGTNHQVGNYPYDFELFRVKPGETVSLATETDVQVRIAVVFKPTEGDAMTILDEIEEANRYIIQHCVAVDSYSGYDRTYSYTNDSNQDYYIAFTVWSPGDRVAMETLRADIDSYVTMYIGPTA